MPFKEWGRILCVRSELIKKYNVITVKGTFPCNNALTYIETYGSFTRMISKQETHRYKTGYSVYDILLHHIIHH